MGTAAGINLQRSKSRLARLVYPLALLASMSLWLFAVRAPLWLDETLSYWQVSGGFWKIWSRSAQMPSSFAYLYILWFAKALLGASEIALKIPSLLAMIGAVYFLFRAARELINDETAWITCTFFCLYPYLVFAATDARPYAFALLVTNAAILAFVRWTKHGQMRHAFLFGAAAAAILYFHYIFGAILPAFAIYYLVVRGRPLRADARQLAAMLATFTVVALPLVFRFVTLYRTRQMHTVPKLPETLVALNTLVPKKLLIGFLATVFVAALLRKVKLPGSDCYPAILLCLLLALVPAGILFAVSTTTSVHLLIPRYCLVAVPGSALTWGLLTSRVDSRLMRQSFCAGLAIVTVIVYFFSPYVRKHELTFKQAFEYANASAAHDGAPVLLCSALIESDFEPLTDLSAENALLAQTSYYRINAPMVLLPLDFSDETVRVGSRSILSAAQRHQRFLAIAGPASYDTLEWIARYASGEFTTHPLTDFDGIVVLEFLPLAGKD